MPQQMKILIAGHPDSGQREVIEKLTGSRIENETSFSGLVLDHKFETKYFTVDCGIWSDEFDSSREWTSEFCSAEAKEVRDVIVMFLFTYGTRDPETAGLGQFVKALGRPGICLAVPKPGVELDGDKKELLSQIGFDVVSFEELTPVVYTTLYDSINEDTSSDELDDPGLSEPPRELEDILLDLKRARDSTNMTKEEKKALAERLAEELI